MSDVENFRNFMNDRFSFFLTDLPTDEATFDGKYSLSMTNLRAVQSQIEKYRLNHENQQRINQLLELAKTFAWDLKTSGQPYANTIVSLKEKWLEIRQLAQKIKMASS